MHLLLFRLIIEMSITIHYMQSIIWGIATQPMANKETIMHRLVCPFLGQIAFLKIKSR